MQISGGYRYPGTAICVILTIVAIGATLGVAYFKSMTFVAALILFLSLEGTVLLASAFTPTGLTPPQGEFTQRVRWFFAQERGVAVRFSQPLFYGGLLALFLSALLAGLR
jgi:hypothetical protein